MTSDDGSVDFRIVNGGSEETGFELVDEPTDVGLVPVDERWELVPRE